MKKFLALFLSITILLLPLEARRRWIPKITSGGGHATAPVFVSAQFYDNPTESSTGQISITINAGDTVLIGGTTTGGVTVSSVTDSGGSTYTQKVINTSARPTWAWGTLSASASTWIQVTYSGSTNDAIVIMRYTGVNAFGNTATVNDTTSGSASISVTTQDANNRVVAWMKQSSNSVGTATNGTIRQQPNAINQGSDWVGSMDNTGALAGTVINSYTMTSTQWDMVAVELRSNP